MVISFVLMVLLFVMIWMGVVLLFMVFWMVLLLFLCCSCWCL